MPEKDTHCLTVYDVVSDKKRHKISEACLDAGLERIQYSAFWGKLTTTKRTELFRKLSGILGKSTGSILVLPVPEDSFSKRLLLEQEGKKENEKKETVTTETEKTDETARKKRKKPKTVTPGEPIQTIIRFTESRSEPRA